MRTTLKDIANKAGVSISTVSLVLNNRPSRISLSTNKRIQEIADELNYHPNNLALGLLNKTTYAIGVIIPDLNNLFFSELCSSCESEARNQGYSISIACSDEHYSQDLNYIDIMLANQIDGIIYAQSASTDKETSQNIYNRIINSSTPFVAVDRFADLPLVKSVSLDNEKGGYLATRHLLELGHKRIGCLTGQQSNETTRARYRGYCKALLEAGIKLEARFIIEGDYSIESGYNALSSLRGQGISAIFCFNDMMALGVYRACKTYGIKIPEDLSVIGYDNVIVSDLVSPPLTTISQDPGEIGRQSIKTLISIINKEDNIKNTVFTPVLKVRASTQNIKVSTTLKNKE